MVEGPSAHSVEKREPVSDIDTAVVDSLKVLDPNRPIREGDIRNVTAARTAARLSKADGTASNKMYD